MKLIKKGCTRIVILIGDYVIKIPNFTVHHLHFLQGCYANWSERNFCKSFKSGTFMGDKVARSYFCSVFGLIQIQQRVTERETDLTDWEISWFSELTTDIKKENFGYRKGILVCLDYA